VEDRIKILESQLRIKHSSKEEENIDFKIELEQVLEVEPLV
jgi:hypothetical protein